MKKKLKFTNLYKLVPQKKEIFKIIKSTIENSNFVGGDKIKNFEDKFSKFVGSRYCVALGNGTDALEIAIKSLNLKKNSEIIVPVNTWISTAEAVVSNNYRVTFCDINLDDYSINIQDLKKKINKNTSAVIPVHLYGYPSNMIEIKKICKKKKLK